ncbi:MAG TPA: response regulator [Acidobacteriaceae bacterium]|nr:response regulator [Acidobacteriaceae bacterium]
MDQALTTNEFRARVLVVDDEHSIAETLSIILAKSGFETAVAHDGREAVAKARNWRPDAIVSDVVMPTMDGIEAAIQILGFLPSCKIVLLSGQAATADLVKHAALKGHYFEILAKPVPPAELLRELSSLQ